MDGTSVGYFGCTVTSERQPALSTTAYFHLEAGAPRLVGIDRQTSPPSLP
jgi:hypothetical protein